MNDELKTLLDRVTEAPTAGDAAVTLINTVRKALDQAIDSGDVEALRELSDGLAAQTTELASAMLAHTAPAE